MNSMLCFKDLALGIYVNVTKNLGMGGIPAFFRETGLVQGFEPFFEFFIF